MFESLSWDWNQVLTDLVRVGIAFVLAFPIGWERSRTARSLGLRTFPLVAIASCGYMLIAKHAPDADAASISRIMQGLLAGIGFIGGGAILKDQGMVYGLATAASIWNTGAVGAAVALDRGEIAVVLSIINFVLLRVLTPIVPTDDYQSKDDTEALPRDDPGNGGD
ncbi:MAG TPA: MgtC/SapB family protein [Ardenticatenaceae bacterium]|nr:MgtC/SapB family protein [Ardenticatenaceae bacterium]